MEVATFVIAVFGAVLSSVSFTWQAVTYVMSGGRVKTELLVGVKERTGPGMIVSPAKSATHEGSLLVRITRGLALVMLGWLAAGIAFSPELANMPWSYWLVITLVMSGFLLVSKFVDVFLRAREAPRGPTQPVEDRSRVGL
jgi:hypothetical protein